MGWPYHFLDLTPDEKSHRRELLSQYAFLSQVSMLIPILGYGIYRLCAWLFVRKGEFDVAYSALRELPGSTESTRESKGVSLKVITRRWRALQWWLNGEVAPNWGLRGRWIAAIVWILWLLVLSFVQTGHGKQCPSNGVEMEILKRGTSKFCHVGPHLDYENVLRSRGSKR